MPTSEIVFPPIGSVATIWHEADQRVYAGIVVSASQPDWYGQQEVKVRSEAGLGRRAATATGDLVWPCIGPESD